VLLRLQDGLRWVLISVLERSHSLIEFSGKSLGMYSGLVEDKISQKKTAAQ
jgi:hypothetical protein